MRTPTLTRPVPESRQTATAQHNAAPHDKTAVRADICTRESFAPDCPFCAGPESD
jgi:hypothetical protein